MVLFFWSFLHGVIWFFVGVLAFYVVYRLTAPLEKRFKKGGEMRRAVTEFTSLAMCVAFIIAVIGGPKLVTSYVDFPRGGNGILVKESDGSLRVVRGFFGFVWNTPHDERETYEPTKWNDRSSMQTLLSAHTKDGTRVVQMNIRYGFRVEDREAFMRSIDHVARKAWFYERLTQEVARFCADKLPAIPTPAVELDTATGHAGLEEAIVRHLESELPFEGVSYTAFVNFGPLSFNRP